MSKLVAEGGQIKKQSMFVGDTFTVKFNRKAICTTGDLGEVILSRQGQDDFTLTFAQAISLANEILRRCQ
jgi:hypothetical protein